MAEKAEKKPEAAAPPAAVPAGGQKEKSENGKKGGGLLAKTPVILGVVMILEAVVLFAGFKFLGAGAKPAHGADLTAESSSEGDGAKSEGEGGEKGKGPVDKKKPVVIKVTEFKAPNKKSGTSFLYDLKICAVTKGEFQKRVEDAIAEQ